MLDDILLSNRIVKYKTITGPQAPNHNSLVLRSFYEWKFVFVHDYLLYYQKLCLVTRYAPAPIPRGCPSAAEQTQHSSSFSRPMRSHGHRCTCLDHALRPRWVKRSGDLDLFTLKYVVSKSRETWATSVLILVFLDLCSRLRPDVELSPVM